MSYNQEWYKKDCFGANSHFFCARVSTLPLTKEFLEMQLEDYGNTS